jgi:hypothetical protein
LDLWWIWEVIIENLTSGEFLIFDEIIARWLSPSVSGISNWRSTIRIWLHVGLHGIIPG